MSRVYNFSAGDVGDIGAGAVGGEDRAAGRRGGPLGIGRPLTAVGNRHSVLPFRCAEVGKIMGKSEATTQTLVSRARYALKQKLLEEDFDYENL